MIYMCLGTGKALGALALTTLLAVVAPAGAASADGVNASVWTVHGHGATAAASVNVLTINDTKGVDNRITASMGPTGRLTLTAPEGLSDPDGSGPNCSLDNAQGSQTSAQDASCAPGYIQDIVGDLGTGNDTFTADADLAVPVGAVIDGQRRPLAGGIGRDRLVGGAAPDLMDGGPGPDSLVGNGGEDLLSGGPGSDNLSGGTEADVLFGGGGTDKLSGGLARDLCNGGGGADSGKTCELNHSIP
jgi:Ca2+-binding RTX toxin-like protein